jgi:sarcosine oxidase subunit beta
VIAILGGGVVGAAVAWGLSRRGRRDVVVYDPQPAGSGSTARAMGGFRTQHGSELNVRLSLASRPWFEARAERIRFQPHGYLYLAETAEVAAELRRRADLQRSFGLPIENPDPRTLVPFLQTGDLHGANFCALDGLYIPPLVQQAFVEEATAAGARFRYGAVPAASELAAAEAVVVCAGIWSQAVGESVGVNLGVSPRERVVWRIGPFPWLEDLRLPMTLEAGSGYHFRERDGFLTVMGPGDQHAWDHYRDWLRRRAPEAAVEQPESNWTGYYEMTGDHHALVGATERPGVWAACGFSGHGVMQSPTVGDSLAAMILGETPPFDLARLSPLRTESLHDPTQL